jgi:hypothetical protein
MPLQHPFHPGAGFRDRVVHCPAQLYLDGQQPGSHTLLDRLGDKYTECERAVLFIVAREVKRQGICDLSVGQTAAEAGVCTRTVQNAVVEAVRQGHVAREERPSGAASTSRTSCASCP